MAWTTDLGAGTFPPRWWNSDDHEALFRCPKGGVHEPVQRDGVSVCAKCGARC
ncbi:hypothetical protein SAMN05421810_104209 [Amycolatopsis arida]|uniref:Uncharacterized protein n=1 Tax=Amycolatopsis arida TaxID=587909 RepID=A0A1I5V2K9_9PSEU|nr:hypothetical protein CLV69_106208 [Amycolatopsis arida]SFQ01794.1 hypothetical protein SAMN05421810_104209 [Amycolatopsis arida]